MTRGTLDNTWRTRVALGDLLVKLGWHDEANAQLAQALKLAITQLNSR